MRLVYTMLLFLVGFTSTSLFGQVDLLEPSVIDSINQLARADSISFHERINYGEKALNLSKMAGYKEGAYAAHINIGVGHLNLSNYTKALDNFQQASLNAADLQEKRYQATSSYFIGNTHSYLDNLEQAMAAHEEAYELYESLDYNRGMGITKNSIGVIQAKLGNTEKALNAFNDSKSIFEKNDIESELSFPLTNIGDHYLTANQPEKALPYFEKTLTLYRKYNYTKGEAITLENLGIAHSKMNNFEIALSRFDQALAIAKEHEYNQVLYECYQDIGNTFKKMKDSDKALEYYEKYYTLRDSIVNMEKNAQIASLSVQYETEKKEKELALSEEKIYQLEHQENVNKLVQYLIIAGFVFILIIGFLFYSRYKVKQELVESELKNKKLESQKLKKELEFKQKDLTNFALDISRKNEFSNKILEALEIINQSQDAGFRKKKVRDLLMMTSNHLKINDDIREFQMNVEKVNQDFFNTLDQHFPDLTSNEKQLCGLIRLNLSTKDIASIRNISPKSVEMGRYRLRKKLSLTPKEEISAFLRRL